MLADDEGVKRQLEGVGFTLEDSEGVLTDVGVLRRIGYKALLGQIVGIVAIGLPRTIGIDHGLRAAFQPVLADDSVFVWVLSVESSHPATAFRAAADWRSLAG